MITWVKWLKTYEQIGEVTYEKKIQNVLFNSNKNSMSQILIYSQIEIRYR